MARKKGSERPSDVPRERADVPLDLAGGLEGAPAFLYASDADIRDAYFQMTIAIRQICEIAGDEIRREVVGSERWLEWARRIDALHQAAHVNGWSLARRARVVLINGIHEAVNFRADMEANRVHVATMDAQWNLPTHSPAEKAAWKTAARHLMDTGYTHGRRFRELGHDPETETALFAAFIFRTLCPAFARGLVSAEGMAALGVAVEAWSAGRGRPSKGAERIPKWQAMDALMKAAGLAGTTADTLEKDWTVWRKSRR